MYKNCRHNPEMDKLMSVIESGEVNKRNAIAQVVDPKVKVTAIKSKAKKSKK